MRVKKRKIIAFLAIISTVLMLACCGKTDTISIDEKCRAEIAGDYQVTGLEDNYWHLYISAEDEPVLSIYDNAAGNPGIEGPIVKLDESTIRIRYDTDLYEALPSDQWRLDGKYLELGYERNDDSLTLTNHGAAVVFQKEPEWNVLCSNWRSENEKELAQFEIKDETVFLKGWVYDDAKAEWSQLELNLELADDCIYNDVVVSQQVIEKPEFLALLDRDEAADTVLELDVLGDFVEEIRLVQPGESMLQEGGAES